MGIADDFMLQYAVYWPPHEGTDNFGRPKLTDPVEIRCRWDDIVEEFVAADGERAISRSSVMVDRVLEIGGWLRLGRMDSLPDDVDANKPDDMDDAFPIRAFQNSPEIDPADGFVRIAKL